MTLYIIQTYYINITNGTVVWVHRVDLRNDDDDDDDEYI